MIQALRRTLRLQGKRYNTEKAYVMWAKRFMAARGLKNLADFTGIGAVDIEAYLTDLAVDGNVAGSTQEQAFCHRGCQRRVLYANGVTQHSPGQEFVSSTNEFAALGRSRITGDRPSV